ncbi:MAG: hypothetical protein AAF571_07060 [Verrucomicrobiota bacterium]
MKAKIQFTNRKQVLRLFKRYGQEVNKSAGALLREQGVGLAKTLIIETQPFGKGARPRKQGKGAIERDVRRAIASKSTGYALVAQKLGEGPAKRFYQLLENGDFKAAEAVLAKVGLSKAVIDQTADLKYHAAARIRGRVKRGDVRQVVRRTPSVKKAVNQVGGRSGWAKAGWYQAGSDLGPVRGVAKWISKHRAPGRGRDMTRKRKPHVLLENRVPYIKKILPSSRVRAAERLALEKFIKRMRFVVRAAERKAEQGGLA